MGNAPHSWLASMQLTINKTSIVVLNPLGQVHVAELKLAVLIDQLSSKNGDLSTAFDGEVSSLSTAGEVFNSCQLCLSSQWLSGLTGTVPLETTVGVANVVVEVDFRVTPFTTFGA